ncbi:hypothetical protein GCM10009827_119570 [Dactylosporangium maewongense]|uniref:Helix-turn-helix domain-containing protein n=1 Tax=Dactylosporangium maewongense TaxID=634393 RepID=A0ABN2DI07_9ACTN
MAIDAEMYADVWRLWVSCRWPGGQLAEVADVLATAGIGRRPGALIINLDAATTQVVLANGWMRVAQMRQMLAQLDDGGMLGQLRQPARGGLGCYALTMPPPPVAAVPASVVAWPASAPSRPARGAGGDPPRTTHRTVPGTAVSSASGVQWAALSTEQRAALTSEVVSRYAQGASVRAVSAQTGLLYSRVYMILAEAGAEMRSRGRQRKTYDDAHVMSVVSRYGSGMSIRAIAGADRVSYHTVIRILIEAGVSRRPGGRRRCAASADTNNGSTGSGNRRAARTSTTEASTTTTSTSETSNGEDDT